MRDLFFGGLVLLAAILLVWDLFFRFGEERPTDCAEEDVPVIPVVPDVTWYLDKDGKIHSSEIKWTK